MNSSSPSKGLPNQLDALTERLSAMGTTSPATFDELLKLLPQAPGTSRREEAAAHQISEPDPPSSLPTTLPVQRAIICDTFILSELLDGATMEGDQIDQLLASSEAVVVSRNSRLRLRPDVRGDLLRRVWGDSQFQNLLRREANLDEKQFKEVGQNPARASTAWLRSFLLGEHGDIYRAPLSEVSAATTALECLECARDLLPSTVPTLQEARRQLQFAELLEPLRILIGSEGGWEGRQAADRFRGRVAELRILRSFIGELGSESLLEGVSRSVGGALRWTGARISGQRPDFLMVKAQGGLGKSALIAKFVLAHVYGADPKRFLFAYLDFDRAGLQTTNPQTLLLEVVRQVALQAPEHGFAELHDVMREGSVGSAPQRRDLAARFRQLVRGWARDQASVFMLVLDTLEIAQFDEKALKAIDRFLTELAAVGADDFSFPELRIVGAGRAPLQDMGFLKHVRTAKSISLKPMLVSDAREMATVLGNTRLGSDWKPAWSESIAGKAADVGDRREPLSIRVATDILIAADPAARDGIAAEMAKDGEGADGSFVARLYAERVLNHVRDEQVRRIAWPGLILRYIDSAIAHEVLAELCDLDVSELSTTLLKLEREVWMVERVPVDGRHMLRHRRELRARTLPLMRRHDPELFAKINDRAIAFFGQRAAEPFARAELVYHLLLAGPDLVEIDTLWNSDVAIRLADAAADFRRLEAGAEPAGDALQLEHAASTYLLARTAVSPLSKAVLRTFPSRLLFDHAGRAGLSLARFDDRRLLGAALEVAGRQRPPGLAPDADTAASCIFIKAGRWNELPPAQPSERWHSAWRRASYYVAARGGKSLDPLTAARQSAHALKERPSSGTTSHDDLDWLGHALAAECIMGDQHAAAELDEILSDMLDHPSLRPETLDATSLRTIASFGVESCRPAARLWAFREYLAGVGPPQLTFSRPELEVLAGELPRLELPVNYMEPIHVALEASQRARGPVRVKDERLGTAVQQLLQYLIAEPQRGVEPLIKHFLAQRQPDWVVPIAYASARALDGLNGAKLHILADRVRSYRPSSWFPLLDQAEDTWEPAGRDFLRLMRVADQASDLPNMLELVVGLAPDQEGREDLLELGRKLEGWRRNLQGTATAKSRRSQRDNDDRPPPPGPILDRRDIQLGRWGGAADRAGRRLTATLTKLRKSSFSVDLAVESVDGSPLQGPVVFHLHDTFEKTAIPIRKIREGRRAVLYDVNAYGAFTVGAQVLTSYGVWTSLEYNLADLPGLPQHLRDK